jgi:hypothetical protein
VHKQGDEHSTNRSEISGVLAIGEKFLAEYGDQLREGLEQFVMFLSPRNWLHRG